MSREPGRNVNVLLVEDDVDIRKLVRTLFQLDGRFTVVGEAENGAHAVGMAKVHQPDAVVLDILMPVMDAASALPLIRLVAPRAVVVTFSALPLEDPRVAALRGAHGHIRKTDSVFLPDLLWQACVPDGGPLVV